MPGSAAPIAFEPSGDPDESRDESDAGPVPVAALDQLRDLVDRTRPVSLAHERTLPVLTALEPLLPNRGLQRGSLIRISGGSGATSLALAALAGPTRAGSWVACIGAPELGWSAAAEVGVRLDRIVSIRSPERSWVTVAAALVDAFDVVLCGAGHRPSTTEARRLMARARERETVVVSVGGPVAPGDAERTWPSVDVRWSVGRSVWTGTGQGWGHLAHRRITVTADGRGGSSRPRRVDLWLPGPDGVTLVEMGDVEMGNVEMGNDVAPVLPFPPPDRVPAEGVGDTG